MNGDIDSDIPCTRRIKVIDINPHLMCVLCGGYYVDATTIIECLHSFCKSCIVRYLDTSKFCPICDVQVHKTKPLLNIRSDQTLQDIVYKLVPGLFQREMRRRREFYAKQPAEALKRTNEERGEVDYASFPHNIFSPDEFISIALEYSAIGGAGISNGHDTASAAANDKSAQKNVCRRYLRCPVVITVAHIKKLIRAKYGLSSEQRVDLMFSRDSLSDEFMIMDIAYMYAWKRKGPLKLYYRIFDQPNKRLKTVHTQPPVSSKDSVKPDSGAAATSTDEKKSSSHQMRSTAIDEGKQSEKKTSPERHSAEKSEVSIDSKQTSSIKCEESKEFKSQTNESSVKTKAMEDEESKKESEKQKDGDKDKKMDVVAAAAAAAIVSTTATSEHKMALEKTTTEDIIQQQAQQQSACEIKTNGDFRANAAEKPPLREKVNGITTNGKDSINISREIESCT